MMISQHDTWCDDCCVNDESQKCSWMNVWKNFTGYFNGFNVIVKDELAMNELFASGNFGKGSLSRGAPTFGKSRDNLPCVVRQRQWERRVDWCSRLMISVDELPGSSGQQGALDELLIIDDTDSEDESYNLDVCRLRGRVQVKETRSIREELHLMLEEAFFLSYALGCLRVHQGECLMSIDDQWLAFRRVVPDFVERYIAYHYFRAKGWVVKSGTKFAGDFLLYKQGPSDYHASYVVLIRSIGDKTKFDMNRLLCLNRFVEATKKELMIVEITRPDDFSDSKFSEISRCAVNEFLIGRWQASANRL